MKATLDNGEITKQMDKVSIYGVLEIDMKENGLSFLNMVMELIISQMVISTQVNIDMESLGEEGNILGFQVLFMRESLKKATNMAREDGKEVT